MSDKKNLNEDASTAMQIEAITLGDFFVDAGFQFQVYDLGRRISSLSASVLSACEAQQQAYPYPFKKKAHLAILFWPPSDVKQSLVWFIALPLDEMGYLSIQARDDFMRTLLTHIGKNINAQHADANMQDVMKESVYAYQPAQDKLALFHALCRRTLGLPPSSYYAAVDEYVATQGKGTDWRLLGIQGMADYCVLVRDDVSKSAALAKALLTMEAPPKLQFLLHLEGGAHGQVLVDALKSVLIEAQAAANHIEAAASLRALACCVLTEADESLLLNSLTVHNGERVSIEILAAFSGRLWERLNERLMPVFLQALAQHEVGAFSALVLDLMHMPEVRNQVLTVKETGHKDSALAAQFDQMLTHFH